MTRHFKTNSHQYLEAISSFEFHSETYSRATKKGVVERVLRLVERNVHGKSATHDDFEWDKYSLHYRDEWAHSKRFFTMDLTEVEISLLDGRLFVLADCKPLHPVHRCVWEAICNLPQVSSIAEIGTGAGTFLAGLRQLLGRGVALSGYDLSNDQLVFFRELFPALFADIAPEVLDITQSAIGHDRRPDVVFESTVLMHIKREDAYAEGLENFLTSAGKYAVLMDNWACHDYCRDLARLAEKHALRLYCYDSGGAVAIVVSLQGTELLAPYEPLEEAALHRYDRKGGADTRKHSPPLATALRNGVLHAFKRRE